MAEIWKYVSNTDKHYSVSNLGRVRSNGVVYIASNGYKDCVFHREPKILKQTKTNDGYLTVRINRTICLVHRLICREFVDNQCNKPFVNHKDGNKTNNCADNLEWVTAYENNIHAIRTGLRPSGEKCKNHKLTQAQVNEIRALHKPHTRGFGCKTLSKKYGVHHSVIQKILNGEKWKDYERDN